MIEKISSLVAESIDVKTKILKDEAFLLNIERAVALVVDAFSKDKKVMFCGNGGSAADAQHLAAEFSGRFYKNRKALPAEALHCNTSYLTAVANDYSYDDIYARLVDGIGFEGDVLIGLSTSGNSKNVVKAMEVGKSKGIITLGLTGINGGNMEALSDILFAVPSKVTPRIQESHILIGHIICELVEASLFEN